MTHPFFCGQNIQRLGEYAKWPGPSPVPIPWHLDLSGYSGNLSRQQILDAFAQAWLWWAEGAEINPALVGSAAEAKVRMHFAAIDGPGQILAWSELADNTNQPKTQRYDARDVWIVTQGNMQGGIDITRVACHEIGHVLGLEHDGQNSGALMAPFVSDSVFKPIPRDITRLLGLGYTKRTTPIPTDPPPPGGLPRPNTIRISRQMGPGVFGDVSLGSKMDIGDYMLVLQGDAGDGPPPIP